MVKFIKLADLVQPVKNLRNSKILNLGDGFLVL